MKNLFVTLLLLAMTTTAAFAQKTKTEQEVLNLNAQYDEALMNKDISFLNASLSTIMLTMTRRVRRKIGRKHWKI